MYENTTNPLNNPYHFTLEIRYLDLLTFIAPERVIENRNTTETKTILNVSTLKHKHGRRIRRNP